MTRRARLVAAVLLGCLLSTGLSSCLSSPPQVVNLAPANGSAHVGGDAPIKVYFDQPVVPSSISSRFSVEPRLTGCSFPQAFSLHSGPCYVTWSDNDSSFTLNHTGAIFTANATYTFKLAAGFVSKAGTVNTLTHYWKLQANNPPAVSSSVPANGTLDVSPDQPLVVYFSRYMLGPPTATSIHLTPKVPGTRVVQNSNDLGRFVIYPGQLMKPNQTYTLSVTKGAQDQFGSPLGVTYRAQFVVGQLSGARVLLIGGPNAHGGSTVQLDQLGPLTAGEPTGSVALVALSSSATTLHPMVVSAPDVVGYSSAALSPTNSMVAVVEQVARSSVKTAPVGSELALFSLPSMNIVALLGDDVSHPSWSSTGTYVSYTDVTGTHFYNTASSLLTTLPTGPASIGPVSWSSSDALAVLPVNDGTTLGVQLCSPALNVRYNLPDAPQGSLTYPQISPDATNLAVDVTAHRSTALELLSLSQQTPPVVLASDDTPLAWIDSSSLLVATPTGGLTTIDVTTDATFPLGQGPPPDLVNATTVSQVAHQIGYLAPSSNGVVQGWVENSDGTGATQITSASATTGAILAVGFSTGQ